MRRGAVLLLLLAGCSAATDAPYSVAAGAYNLVSINGKSLPVPAEPAPPGGKLEVVGGRLYLGGTAGPNGALQRMIYRTTIGSAVTVDSSSATGTFYPTGATAQTTFGTVSVVGNALTLKATDGTVRMFNRQ